MSQIVTKVKNEIKETILSAAAKCTEKGVFPAETLPEFNIEIPSDRSHGDYAVNAAMVWAKSLHNAPRKIAETLAEYFDFADTYIDRFEIAGPGFINFFI